MAAVRDSDFRHVFKVVDFKMKCAGKVNCFESQLNEKKGLLTLPVNNRHLVLW